MNFSSKTVPLPSRHLERQLDYIEEMYCDPPEGAQTLESANRMYGHLRELIGSCRALMMAVELRNPQHDEPAESARS